MIRKFLYVITGLLCISISAQQPSRFPIKPGSVWRINYEYCCGEEGWTHQNGDEEYKYFVDGDTLIGTRTYFKLFKTGILYLDTPFRIEHKYMGAIRDSANRFYIVTKDEQHESLLYNFGAGVGEIMQPDGFPVDEIDTLENGRKSYYFGIISVHCGSANTIIEGIGWLGGLLEGNSCSGHPGVRGSYLVCYSEDGEVVYQTERTWDNKTVSCNLNITSINPIKTDNQLVVLVTENKGLKISLPENQSLEWCFNIYSINGINTIKGNVILDEVIDVSSLSVGTYIVQLINKEEVRSAKFVIY